MRLAAFLFVTIGAIAQTGIGPAVPPCTPPQIIIATPLSTPGFYKFSCATIDASVAIDKITAPWTIKTTGGQCPASPIAGLPLSSFPSGALAVQLTDGSFAPVSVVNATAQPTPAIAAKVPMYSVDGSPSQLATLYAYWSDERGFARWLPVGPSRP